MVTRKCAGSEASASPWLLIDGHERSVDDRPTRRKLVVGASDRILAQVFPDCAVTSGGTTINCKGTIYVKRFLIILVATAMAFVGFAPGASAEEDVATSERCERQEQIEQRLTRKMDKIAAKADRIEMRMDRVAERIDSFDSSKKNFEKRMAKAERRMERLESKAAKNQERADRVEAKLAKLMAECGGLDEPVEEAPVEEAPEEEALVEETPGEEAPEEDQVG